MTVVELDNEGYTCMMRAAQWFIVDRYGVPVEAEDTHPTYEPARARAEALNADVIRRRVGR